MSRAQTRWIALLLAGIGLQTPTGAVMARTKQIADVPVSHDIIWGDQITLTPPNGTMGRYPRLVDLKTGPHKGDLLLTYQTDAHGGDFMMYRSSDRGRTWADPVLVNKATPQWDFASCNIIQLTDGRLLMSMQRRVPGSNLGKNFYIDVKFSDDGGETWGKPQQVFQGANWEGRPFEVPNDMNGDGIKDIYLFFTQHVIDTTIPAEKAKRHNDHGRAISFVASYDGGKTWVNHNTERFTGKIIHRDYQEGANMPAIDESGGGMPQPFLLPDNRVGFVVEELQKKQSPMIVANDPGDWDWTGAPFQGQWTSADYDGSTDNNVYPTGKEYTWAPQDIEFSKAPYIAAVADGRYVMASQTPQIIRVWVGDKTAHDFKPQELPFGKNEAVFPMIEPISPTEVLVAGGSYKDSDNFIYLRFGTLK
ncbi:MAG: sialidase family protein [bacterium]